MIKNIVVLHGPNLNLLGEREPEVYGYTTLLEINEKLLSLAAGMDVSLVIKQSNHEGVLIDTIHEYRKWADAIIMNPGAFTHYSYALRDALSAFIKPVIEVHLSDIMAREEFRKHSVLDGLPNVRKMFGKGDHGYYEALNLLVKGS